MSENLTDNLDALVEKSIELGAAEARLVPTDQVYFDPRSFLKCRFGCARWGKFWTCPPNMDISPERFMAAFEKYSWAMVIKATDPKVGQDVCLAIEKEAMGVLLFCRSCRSPDITECKKGTYNIRKKMCVCQSPWFIPQRKLRMLRIVGCLYVHTKELKNAKSI